MDLIFNIVIHNVDVAFLNPVDLIRLATTCKDLHTCVFNTNKNYYLKRLKDAFSVRKGKALSAVHNELQSCEYCDTPTRSYNPFLKMTVCFRCRSSISDVTITKTNACYEFKLRPTDLAKLDCILSMNKKYKIPCCIYQRKAVIMIALAKHGELCLQKIYNKIEQRKKIYNKQVCT